MDAKERAERALRHAPIMPTAKEAVLIFVEVAIQNAEREAIMEFVERVETRAERNMEKAGITPLEKAELAELNIRAHYAAMKAELARLDTTPEQ